MPRLHPKISDSFETDTKPAISMGDFIYQESNSLEESFCDHLISRFNSDGRTREGGVGDGQINRKIKQTIDMQISQYDDWGTEDDVLYEALKDGMTRYYDHVNEITDGYLDLLTFQDYEYKDSGYQIQRYEPGEFYRWHHDYKITFINGARVFTFMWYLNTVHEGGNTDFVDGSSIKPEAGKLVIFPGTWTYLHRACPPIDQQKYICTGWIHTKPYNKEDNNETSESDT